MLTDTDHMVPRNFSLDKGDQDEPVEDLERQRKFLD
jgi:hypothetical protein